MADKEVNMENALRINDQERPRGHETPRGSRLGNSIDHKSVQTEKVQVRHTGVQFEPPTPMDVGTTDTHMSVPSSQTVANRTDTQMTAASSVNVESSSGTQIGGGNSIVHNHNNNTYNVTNKTFNIFANVNQFHPNQVDDLIRWAEQQTVESGNQSPALPPGDVTNQVPNSHSMRKIKTVTSRTVIPNESEVPDNQIQTATSQSNRPCSPSPDVQSRETKAQQTARVNKSTGPKLIKSSERNCPPERRTRGSNSPKSNNPFNDVTNTASCRSAQGKTKEVQEQQATCSTKAKSQQTPTGSRSANIEQCSSIQDSVCIIDSSGQTLVPGDAVWFGNILLRWSAIYTGHQQVVLCRGPGCLVEKKELNLTQPFGKCRVVRGDVRSFPRGEVISRAESRVGTKFTEGDWDGSDFPVWAMTGLGGYQALSRCFIVYCTRTDVCVEESDSKCCWES